MKCTELVVQDHMILRRALDILDGMIQKLQLGERIEIADATSIAKFIRSFGVEYHQTMEERILFPALVHRTPPESPLRNMLLEHAEQRALFAAMDKALETRKGNEFVRNARGIIALFRSHFDREDASLREITSISKEQDDAVLREMMELRRPPESYINLPALEGKYVPNLRATPRSSGRPLARVQSPQAG